MIIVFFLLLSTPLHAVVIESFEFDEQLSLYDTQEQISPEVSQEIASLSLQEISTPTPSSRTTQASDEIVVLTQSVNSIIETLQQIHTEQRQLSQKVEGLENHQREFMGYIHNKLLAKNELTGSEKCDQDYESGLVLMKQNKMEAGLKHWQEFIELYPTADKVPAAYYWIGEIYYVMQKDDFAKDAYMHLVTNHPEYEKSSDAMYKIGQIFYNQGSIKEAQGYWQKIVETYPQSSVSKLAKQQLSEIRT